MKKIGLIFSLFMLFGCSGKTYEEWQIPLENIEYVTMNDYNNYFDEPVVLNENDYIQLIESYNNIKDIEINQKFNENNPTFGLPMYEFSVKYKYSEVKTICLSEVGYLSVSDKENNNYYNVNIFEDFHDLVRKTAEKYEFEVNSMVGTSMKDDYVQIISKYKDYLVGCEMNLNEFYSEIGVSKRVDESLTVGEYLSSLVSEPHYNDVIETDEVTFKLLGVKDESILTAYVRVKE